MFTWSFWRSIIERAIKTFAATLGGSLAGLALAGSGLTQIDWWTALSITGLSTLASVLLNISNARLTDGNPSFGSVETLTADAPPPGPAGG